MTRKRRRLGPEVRPPAVKVHALTILPEALKALEAVGDAKLKRRIVEHINALANEPRPAGCKALGDGLTRIRVSNCRVIYRIVDDKVQVCVLRIAKRDEVYLALQTLANATLERGKTWAPK